MFALSATTALLLGTTACGGSDSLEDQASGGSSGSGDQGSVVVGGQDFTESQVMAAIYQRLLEDARLHGDDQAGHDPRRLPARASKGSVDIVPDYLAGLTDYLNTEKNGPDAPPVSSNDPEETLAALEPLAKAKGPRSCRRPRRPTRTPSS